MDLTTIGSCIVKLNSEINVNIRLVPTYLLGEMQIEPTHHTEVGMFNLNTYLVPIEVKGNIYDLHMGQVIPMNAPIFALYAYLFWMGHVVQKHLVIVTNEENVNQDAFVIEKGLTHSQAIHDLFGTYLEGTGNVFPSLRALGWAFVPFNEVLAIQMWEQRAIHQALTIGNFDFENMLDWAIFLNMVGTDDDVTKSPLDNPDMLGVNLNKKVRSFLDDLEKRQDDDEESTGIT